MQNKEGSARNSVLILLVLCLLVIAGLVYLFFSHKTSVTIITPPTTLPTTPTTPVTPDTYGMSQYVDTASGFSFWYPSALKVTSTMTQDTKSFPGGTMVETLLIGDMGSTSVSVVDSKTSTITDEPNGHASPIAQTKYSYDSKLNKWMVSYPEGTPTSQGSATPTPANISKTTMSGLVMLPSGKRFDTTIIPLTTTRFLVVSDGGGSSFTSELASTVSPIGVSVPSDIQSATLQAEGAAYSQ